MTEMEYPTGVFMLDDANRAMRDKLLTAHREQERTEDIARPLGRARFSPESYRSYINAMFSAAQAQRYLNELMEQVEGSNGQFAPALEACQKLL